MILFARRAASLFARSARGFLCFLLLAASLTSSSSAQVVDEIWTDSFAIGPRNDILFGVGIDSTDSIIAAGYVEHPAVGDNSGRNAFVVKYDSSGSVLWSNEVNSSTQFSDDRYYGVVIDSNDNADVCGTLSGTYPPAWRCFVVDK